VTATVRATATVTATTTATVTATPSSSPTASPTPTPTATPTAPPPSSGWPDASNTGWSGTLTAYTGPLTITTPGTVIDSKIVTGTLLIRAANVTVTNSQVNGTVYVDEDWTGSSVTVTDSVVDAGQKPGTGIGDINFTVLRTEVIGGNRSIYCYHACEVRDSYVHGQFRDSTGVYHESGIRMSQNTTLVHNSIVCDAPEVPPDAGCSADLTGYGDFEPVANNLIQGNLFRTTASGGFCAYGGSSGGKPYSNAAHDVRFVDNVFERGRLNDHGQPDCGAYGAITDFDPSRPGNVWTNNRYVDGTPVTP
jgi:hypothetical protein